MYLTLFSPQNLILTNRHVYDQILLTTHDDNANLEEDEETCFSDVSLDSVCTHTHTHTQSDRPMRSIMGL